jgi:hypothetical protein
MHLRYCVELEDSERQQLERIVAGGTRAVRRVKRAQILLAAARGRTDELVATTVRVARVKLGHAYPSRLSPRIERELRTQNRNQEPQNLKPNQEPRTKNQR